MSMWLILAKVEAGLLEAVRADPRLLDKVLCDDESPMPDELAAAFDAEADIFEADYLTLSAIAEVMTAREWFEKATGGTESLDYDDFTYGPAFALSPGDVSEVAQGLIAEGWHAGGAIATPSDETAESVQRSAQSLGEAAEWDPEEVEAYGPMMAATGSAEFNVKVVQALGATAGWDSDTIARVAASVAVAEPEEFEDDEDDLATFFLNAAAQGRAVVGGIT